MTHLLYDAWRREYGKLINKPSKLTLHEQFRFECVEGQMIAADGLGPVGEDPCEWDPVAGVPSSVLRGRLILGCGNRAELIVGANGKWRLCASCAALPKFKRFRKRKPIARQVEEASGESPVPLNDGVC